MVVVVRLSVIYVLGVFLCVTGKAKRLDVADIARSSEAYGQYVVRG